MPEVTFFNKNYAKFYSLLIVFFAATLFAGQYFIERKDFNFLVGWQLVLHVVFISFYFTRKYISLQQLLFAAIILRIGSAFIMPSLSDDVYRFIWDGHLIVSGQNPLLTTPDDYLSALNTSNVNYLYLRQLHGLINHPQFYTCYPPLMQGVFTVAAFFGGSSVFISIIIIKLIVAVADCAAVYFIIKILRKINSDVKLVVLYALNPLVIIEGAGNAHFEVMQVALLVISIYFILKQMFTVSAIFWGLAIVTKLLPLLLLPLIIRLLGFKKGLLFSSIAVAVAVLLFLPFLSTASVDGFAKSINLYFQNFEFNASLYYLAREVGWWLKGYNYISFIGPFLMVIFLTIYAVIFFMKRKLSLNEFALYSLIILSLYYFFATTVHPWYIINLLPLALVANKKYAFVWMGIAFLSYNAYGNINFKENYYLVFLEYLVVVIAMVYSFKKDKIISSV
jgi:Gpi18-like mannosyltransferase